MNFKGNLLNHSVVASKDSIFVDIGACFDHEAHHVDMTIVIGMHGCPHMYIGNSWSGVAPWPLRDTDCQ